MHVPNAKIRQDNDLQHRKVLNSYRPLAWSAHKCIPIMPLLWWEFTWQTKHSYHCYGMEVWHGFSVIISVETAILYALHTSGKLTEMVLTCGWTWSTKTRSNLNYITLSIDSWYATETSHNVLPALFPPMALLRLRPGITAATERRASKNLETMLDFLAATCSGFCSKSIELVREEESSSSGPLLTSTSRSRAEHDGRLHSLMLR